MPAPVVEEAVAVGVSRADDPVDGAADRGRERAQRVVVDGAPPPRLGGETDEERGGVDRAVVAAPRRERTAAPVAPQLVQDPAGLLLGRRVVGAALQVGEGGQHAFGERAVERQRHPGGQQGVTAEEGHEPRSTRGDDRPIRVGPVDDPQGRQVGQGLVDGSRQARVEGDRRGHGASARQTARGSASPARAPKAAAGGGHAGRHGLHGDRDGDLLPTGDLQAPPRGAAGRVGLVRLGVHHDLGAVLFVEGRGEPPPTRGDALGARRRRGGRPAALHVEDVGEVGRELQLEPDGDGQGVRVAQGQLLDQAACQPPTADDQDLRDIGARTSGCVVLTAVLDGREDAGDDDGGHGCGGAGGQQLDPAARHRHAQPAQMAYVVVDQPMGGGDHVAGLVADREAAAVDGDEVVTPARGDGSCREV